MVKPFAPSKNRPFRKKHQKWVFIIERCSKLSSFRIYIIFWKKVKFEATFEVNIEPTPAPHFFEEKWCVELRVSPIKESQLNFITLRITIHPWLPWLLFTAFCRTFSTVSYLDMLLLTKKNKRYSMSLEWEILNRKLASFDEYLH